MGYIPLSRSKLKEQILRLEQGFPQNWIYLERKVKNSLRTSNNDGVKASQNFVGKITREIFHKDILSVYNHKIAKIRPIIGANGSGKTTLLQFHVKEFLESVAPTSNLFLFFDFKAVTDNVEDFWSIFVQNIISQLIPSDDENILSDLIKKLSTSKRRLELIKLFKNKIIVDNLLKLSSMDSNEQDSALEYFYGAELETKSISDLFYGILKLAFKLNFIVVIAFDEIQFLNEIDPENVLLKMFLEKFVRYLMEQYSSERFYILISCLENPEEKEWTNLKGRSKNFETIVKNKEIILGNLTAKERDGIIHQVADKIGFESNEQKRFFSKVKGSMLYYLPRELLKCIANVIDSMEYVSYTEYDIRQIYEDDARDYMGNILREKGFIHIDSKEKKIGGYNVDIYATIGTQRAGYLNKAFGEVTMIKKESMKQKIEKFANWLLRMQGREYKPDKGDFAFFVSQPNAVTSGAKEVLDANNIKLFEFTSPNIEQLILKNKETAVIKEREEEESVIIIKEKKYELTDVPGIGPAKKNKLVSAGIYTIKDLLNCNVKIKAKEISGVGEVSLNKWRQNARQILNE